jgi:hypothetical protein
VPLTHRLGAVNVLRSGAVLIVAGDGEEPSDVQAALLEFLTGEVIRELAIVPARLKLIRERLHAQRRVGTETACNVKRVRMLRKFTNGSDRESESKRESESESAR